MLQKHTVGWDMMQMQKFSWKGDIKGEHGPTVWLMQLMIRHQRLSAVQRQTQGKKKYFYFLSRQNIPTNPIIKMLCLFPHILMQHLHWHAYFCWDCGTHASIKEWLCFSVYGETPDAFNFFPFHRVSISLQVTPFYWSLVASQWWRSHPELCFKRVWIFLWNG